MAFTTYFSYKDKIFIWKFILFSFVWYQKVFHDVNQKRKEISKGQILFQSAVGLRPNMGEVNVSRGVCETSQE